MDLALIIFTAFATCLSEEVLENPGFTEGDFLLTPDQRSELYGLGTNPNPNPFAATTVQKWPIPVPYDIDEKLEKNPSFMKNFKLAIDEFETTTCLRFRRVANISDDHIYFYQGQGCHTMMVGYFPGGPSPVSLGVGCTKKGYIQHELAHALGFFHEQSRPDRDYYVKILWDNIPKGFHSQFKRYASHVDSLNVPYDYLSLMHYAPNAFSGAKLSIETVDPAFQYKIGQREGLSNLDILQMNLMYNCPGFTKPPPYTLPATSSTPPPATTLSTTPVPTTAPNSLPVTMTICDYTTQQVQCTLGRKVEVISAEYGRTLPLVCRSGYVPDVACKRDVTGTLQKGMNGKSSVWQSVNTSQMGGDPCPQGPGGALVTKYLVLVYRCIN